MNYQVDSSIENLKYNKEDHVATRWLHGGKHGGSYCEV